MKKILGFVIGVAVFMVIYWLGGWDVPASRSPELSAFALLTLLCGFAGMELFNIYSKKVETEDDRIYRKKNHGIAP